MSKAISNQAAILLYELHDAYEREAFAVACDGLQRKLAWQLDKIGFAEWRGTNWGSSFFSITEAGRAFIDAEVSALGSRLAALHAQRTKRETGAQNNA